MDGRSPSMHALAFLILAWNPDETGTSTEWSSLPTPVEQSFTLASVHDLSVLVIADFSSVQSEHRRRLPPCRS